MTMNFDTDLDRGVAKAVVHIPRVEERIEVRAVASASTTHAFTDASTWEWSQLRDYVVAEIEQRFGPFPREANKEYGIFTSFMKRWGDQAVTIAKYAFETCDGMWRGAPVSVFRFAKASDPYFAQVIAERLF